jgi:plastocyanin
MVRSIPRAMVAGLAIAASLTVGLAGTALAADHAVSIQGFAFSPGTVTIAVGDTVTWTNGDSPNHTATADDGSFDTGSIANGASASATFSTAGTFGYHCAIHASMTATIVVAGTPPPTDTLAGPIAPDRGAGLARCALLALAAFGGLLLGAFRVSRRRRPERPETLA